MNEAIFAQDTATIARLRDENLAKLRRIEEMRLEITKLAMAIQRDDIRMATRDDEVALILRLETIRGEHA